MNLRNNIIISHYRGGKSHLVFLSEMGLFQSFEAKSHLFPSFKRTLLFFPCRQSASKILNLNLNLMYSVLISMIYNQAL